MRSAKALTVIRGAVAGVAAAVVTGILYAAPAAADVATDTEVVRGWTTARAWATGGALVAFAGAVLGGLAMRRAAKGAGNGGRNGALLSIGLSVIGLVTGVLVVVLADGGPGTGNGIVGGYIAIPLGLAGLVLSWRALTRAKAAE